MKILIISDIHANMSALKILDKYIAESDVTVCLGDILGYHCDINETIEYIRKKDIVCIVGNHDKYIIDGVYPNDKYINKSVEFGIEYAKIHITKSNFSWLKSLPTSFSGIFDNKKILFCHGSPWDVTNEYLYENSDKLVKLDDFNFDVIAVGHTHRSYINITKGNKLIFNPGSVGQSRDRQGYVCAKILDTSNTMLSNIEIAYDYCSMLEKCKKNGAKEWLYKHFKND